MEQALTKHEIDFVLSICNSEYARRANDRKGGVGYESGIILPQIGSHPLQTKYIPVILETDPNGLLAGVGNRTNLSLRSSLPASLFWTGTTSIMNKPAEYAIGEKEVKDYKINEEYFSKIGRLKFQLPPRRGLLVSGGACSFYPPGSSARALAAIQRRRVGRGHGADSPRFKSSLPYSPRPLREAMQS